MRTIARAALTAAFVIAALRWSLAEEQPYARDGAPAVPPQFAQGCESVTVNSVVIGLRCCATLQGADKRSASCISVPLLQPGRGRDA